MASTWLPQQAIKITLTRAVFGYMRTVHPETLELPGWSPSLWEFYESWKKTPVPVIEYGGQEFLGLVDVLEIATNLNNKTRHGLIPIQMIDLMNDILVKVESSAKSDEVTESETESLSDSTSDGLDTSLSASPTESVESGPPSVHDDDDTELRISIRSASVSGRSTPSSASPRPTGKRPSPLPLHGRTASDPIYNTRRRACHPVVHTIHPIT